MKQSLKQSLKPPFLKQLALMQPFPSQRCADVLSAFPSSSPDSARPSLRLLRRHARIGLRLALALLCAPLALAPVSARASADKPIRFIVPFAAGTATDQLARVLGQAISMEAKQTVVIDNKPGANAFIGAEAAAHAPADGSVVFIATNTTQAAAEHLYRKLPFDPVRDFAPVTGLGRGGQILVVNATSPVRSVNDLIALAKSRPGQVSFGSGSSSSRVAGELFQQMAGVQLLHVPYKSNTFAVTDLIGGQVQMMLTDTATGLPQVKNGKLRALAYSARSRSPLMPDLPTLDEAGVKGYDMGYWFAAYVPARTPAPVVKRLNELLHAAARSPGAQQFYASTGTELFLTSPEELARFQQTEARKWGEVIRRAGIEKE